MHAQMHRLAEEVRSALEALRKDAPAAAAAPDVVSAASVDAAAGGEHDIARLKRWLLQGGRLEP